MIVVLLLLACFATSALNAPTTDDEAIVNITIDDQGRYKFSSDSNNVTRSEERFLDGSVKGSFSYLDDKNQRRVVSYTRSIEGLSIEGAYPQTTDAVEPEYLPEVSEAKRQFLVIAENAKQVDLARKTFLKVVSQELNLE